MDGVQEYIDKLAEVTYYEVPTNSLWILTDDGFMISLEDYLDNGEHAVKKVPIQQKRELVNFNMMISYLIDIETLAHTGENSYDSQVMKARNVILLLYTSEDVEKRNKSMQFLARAYSLFADSLGVDGCY